MDAPSRISIKELASDRCPLFYAMMVFLASLSSANGLNGVSMTVESNGVDVGAVAKFQCLQTVNDQPVVVSSWLLDGRPFLRDPRHKFTTATYNNTLVIVGARRSDSGIYTCVTRDGEKASQKLYVYCPVDPVRYPVTRVLIGGDVTLRCDGGCYDSIYWAKNGVYIDASKTERFSLSENRSRLDIKNVSLSDNGTYLCQFIANKLVYSTVELLVIVPARKSALSTSRRTPQVGNVYKICCQCDGVPLPESAAWYNDSALVNESERIATQYDRNTGTAILSIRHVTRYDRVRIECRFKQKLVKEFRYTNSSILVVPTGKPDPPTNLVIHVKIAKSVTLTTVGVSWTPPMYTGYLDMLAYRVAYWDDNACAASRASRASRACKENSKERGYWLPASVTSHEFDLESYTNYTRLCFVVQSVNNNGLSNRSDGQCIGVVQHTQSTPSPSTVATRSPTMTQSPSVGTVLPQSTTPSASRTAFQVVLENTYKLCFGLLKLNEELLTQALASFFSRLCSCVVLPSDIITDLLAQLGGIVYYRGSVVSLRSEQLVSNLSSFVALGAGRIDLSGNYLTFLQSCSVTVTGDSCRLSEQDSSPLSCGLHNPSTSIPTKELVLESSSHWRTLSFALVASLIAFTILLLIYLYWYHRHKKSGLSERSLSYSSARNPNCSLANGNGADSDDKMSVTYASTASSSEANDVDTCTFVKPPSRRCHVCRYDRRTVQCVKSGTRTIDENTATHFWFPGASVPRESMV